MAKKMRVKEWFIHKLGGYTHQEVFDKAWQIAKKIYPREYKGGDSE